MAELVDAPASGAGTGNGVGVRVPFWAPKNYTERNHSTACYGLFFYIDFLDLMMYNN